MLFADALPCRYDKALSRFDLILRPPGTPAGIALKISDDLRKVLVRFDLGRRLDELGTYVNPTTPAELTNFIREQQQIWHPIISETAKTIR